MKNINNISFTSFSDVTPWNQTKTSNYPNQFDNDENLYLVYDALKIPLGIDYYPGNDSVLADGDISKFPPSGIITLVDQHNSPRERAISLYYESRTNREFKNLNLLSDSIDCFKPKKITYITLQAMANHREALKDAIISIEEFLGTKHETEVETIFGRLNFLKKVLFAPKAWFEIEKSTGVAPFTVNFTFTGSGDSGPIGDVIYTWKINDEEVSTTESTFEKIILTPGNYTASLKIKNEYGEDTVTFIDVIKVKGQAPEEISIKFLPFGNQIHIDDIIPKIRTPINQPVLIETKNPIKPSALVNTKTVKQENISSYSWNLNDDLPHANSNKTKALYTIGGYYDATLRMDTDTNSYRITTYENCIDVVEPINLWIWTTSNQTIRSHEFGLISEVLKTSKNDYSIKTNDSFIENDRQKFEFLRNNGCVKKDTINSGNGGNCLLFWASGRNKEDTTTNEKIRFATYNGFADSYKVENSISRPWNWAALASEKNIYFAFGLPTNSQMPTLSLTNKLKTTYNIDTDSAYNDSIEYRNFKNGAHDLATNPGVLNEKYDAPNGHYSAYRTTWKDNIGYIIRNSNLGDHFSFQNFYKTEGTLGSPFNNLVKLPDMPGENKEGSLVPLNNGIYFFNNHGSTYCFNDTTTTWESVNSHNKVARNDLYSLLASSDNESRAYINIENTAFFKFNEIDMSYIMFNQGSVSNQWLMSVY